MTRCSSHSLDSDSQYLPLTDGGLIARSQIGRSKSELRCGRIRLQWAQIHLTNDARKRVARNCADGNWSLRGVAQVSAKAKPVDTVGANARICERLLALQFNLQNGCALTALKTKLVEKVRDRIREISTEFRTTSKREKFSLELKLPVPKFWIKF